MLKLTYKRVVLCSVDSISKQVAINKILSWAASHKSTYIVFANAHVIVSACQNHNYMNVVNSANLVLPDGAPVAWMIRRLGNNYQSRLSGPDLMIDLCYHCQINRISIYLYGSTEKNLTNLKTYLIRKYPHLLIAGAESPPFRPLSDQELIDTAYRINSSGAGVVFVGLGCPKQEFWMSRQKMAINAVMLGVGAAFDFYSGTSARAPVWMRNNGLEWFFRLCSEPRRLWKRYLVTNSLFLILAMKQFCEEYTKLLFKRNSR